jgi:hypothetical protein
MKSTFLLLEDIVAEIEKGFKGMVYESKPGLIEPNIYIGHVPPKRSMPTGTENDKAENTNSPLDGDPPFVLVRYLEDEERKDNNSKARVSDAKVGILCCVYSQDSYTNIKMGYKDIYNMSDRILLTIVSKRYWGDNSWWIGDEPIKRTFGVEKELSSIYEAGADGHPFYGGAVVATFKSTAIERNII